MLKAHLWEGASSAPAANPTWAAGSLLDRLWMFLPNITPVAVKGEVPSEEGPVVVPASRHRFIWCFRGQEWRYAVEARTNRYPGTHDGASARARVRSSGSGPHKEANMKSTHESRDHDQDEALVADRHDRAGDAEGGRATYVEDGRAGYDERRAAAQAERFGGVKVGSAFFGWLTAMGMAVVLTAVLAAAGTAVGLSTGTDATEAVDQASADATTVGIVGAIALAVILLVSYYCGGYVAGRMARFNGAKQGVAVWVWALVVAVVVAIVGVAAGSKYDVLGQLNSFPRLPISTSDLNTAGVIALVLAAVTSLVGAIAGGVAGMRFHRRVDRVDLEA